MEEQFQEKEPEEPTVPDGIFSTLIKQI